MISPLLHTLASSSTGLLKALHKLGVPDWVVWVLFAVVILFVIVRRLMRTFED